MGMIEEQTELELIESRIRSLYPDFTIIGYRKEFDCYIIEIKPDTAIPGSELEQKWTVEENKAVFIGTTPGKRS
jgi:hypothetical protein